MTLDELLEELNALPKSARSATTFARIGTYDDEHILRVFYEDGVVVIEVASGDEDDTD